MSSKLRERKVKDREAENRMGSGKVKCTGKKKAIYNVNVISRRTVRCLL